MTASYDLNWPPELEGLFDQFSILGETSESILSFECMISGKIKLNYLDLSSMDIPVFFMKGIIAAVLPIISIIILALIWLGVSCCIK